MYTGRYMKKDTPRHNHSTKPIIILVSTLVLLIGMVGGTLAYLAVHTAPVENTFEFGTIDPTIPEQFDGTVKTDVKVANNGSIDVFVRARIVVTWKNGSDVSSTVPVLGTDYTMTTNPDGGWFEGSDGFWYCRTRVGKGNDSPILIGRAEKTQNAVVPEGYDLSIEILAQSVQADGMKDGVPMVQAIGWPVTVADGQLQ